MTDDHELAGLNPFDHLDQEARRLDDFFSGLAESAWSRPSRCAGWTTRDVLGHLAMGEDYHRSCLDGTVNTFISAFAERGAADLDSVSALGVADYAPMTPAEVLAYWRREGAANRRRFRERADAVVDTSIGEYPCRWQAFHVASELATHADDIGVVVPEDQREARRAWRARFSRFALSEAKPELDIVVVSPTTLVIDGSRTVQLDEVELIEAVMARLDETCRFDEASREMLSTMP